MIRKSLSSSLGPLMRSQTTLQKNTVQSLARTFAGQTKRASNNLRKILIQEIDGEDEAYAVDDSITVSPLGGELSPC